MYSREQKTGFNFGVTCLVCRSGSRSRPISQILCRTAEPYGVRRHDHSRLRARHVGSYMSHSIMERMLGRLSKTPLVAGFGSEVNDTMSCRVRSPRVIPGEQQPANELSYCREKACSSASTRSYQGASASCFSHTPCEQIVPASVV